MNETLGCEIHPALNLTQAKVEASRCYYCYDAPCIRACPTQIDIPSFIRKISNSNIRGAALDILSANILGGTCARVCPVETLCQEACVRESSEQKPVQIGLLQRFATDEFFKSNEQPFKRQKPNGLKVAVFGGGPAGLACAHALALKGYQISLYESKDRLGGLNEYGLAPYKVSSTFTQKEIDFVLSVGGIEVKLHQTLGKDFTLDEIRKKYDAVFLGFGLGSTQLLQIPGENHPRVMDAVKYIDSIRVALVKNTISNLLVTPEVVVIGGGNTAIDIAIEMKRLGADSVTLVYRRGEAQMGATSYERELARKEGVRIKTWLVPKAIFSKGESLEKIEFYESKLDSASKLITTDKVISLSATQIFKAIGQKISLSPFEGSQERPELASGKIVINEQFQTTLPKVFAGGDLVKPGEDLTVTAVQHGKQAAVSIDQVLKGEQG